MKIRIHPLLPAIAFFTVFLTGSVATAAPQASVQIDQISGKSLGSWTMFSGNGATRTSSDPGANAVSYSLGLTEFGPVTLTVAAPQGMSVKIAVYRGGDLLKTVDVPQYSFTLFPNDKYRFLIQYSLDRLGSIGITSTPSGVRFRMKSESTRTYTGVTPFTFKNIPAGRYSVTMSASKGCTQPRPESAIVTPEVRSTLNVTMNCESNQVVDTVNRSRPTKRALTEYAEQRELNRRGNRK